ncbi:hypothetical protein AAFF_G00097980 [Aldrovandia affinis]|uniref:Uncharacterized protein n=1 Tax=Aldrovandia affinis TaxID=143900 RepID=A0AAD7WC02_9TELE|nr:hypothetical protein AAFF_G00097980 [Aldrovandia affinis]
MCHPIQSYPFPNPPLNLWNSWGGVNTLTLLPTADILSSHNTHLAYPRTSQSTPADIVGTTPNPRLKTTPSPDKTNPGPTLRRRPSTKPQNSPAKGHSQKTSRTGRRPRAHRQWRSRIAAGAPPPLTLPHLTPTGTPEGDTTWQ